MSLLRTLQHLFLPNESNNYKAKLIHTSSFFLLTLLFLSFQLILGFIPSRYPQVLGYANNISASEVIRLTNEKRTSIGLLPLNENSSLINASLAKGQDMLSKGYWAHFAPDGTSPWSFFSKFGYKYRYAGENLARDFTNPNDVVSAWMNSPTHKKNILNPKYSEIGVSVIEGKLNGVETTLVIQFFGTRQTATKVNPIPNVRAEGVSTESSSLEVANAGVFNTSRNISLFLIGLVVLVLSIDLLLVRPEKISRISGRNLAHISYLGMVIAVVIILKSGEIL